MSRPILNSWKEIAQYIGLSERTVQRWEKYYAFPVRRPMGNRRSAVLALPTEINEWVKKRSSIFGRTAVADAAEARCPGSHAGNGCHPAATLLCIDDHRDGLAVRKVFLEAIGYRVLAADDGQAGLELFEQNAVDLVVLDYRMEGMDGEAVAESLRRRKPEMPILMLSGHTSDVPKRVLRLVNEFIPKGQPTSVLLAAIERVLQSSGKSVATEPGDSLATKLPAPVAGRRRDAA